MENVDSIKKRIDLQNDIVRIEEMGNKTFLIFTHGEVSESLLNIEELDASLSKKGFVRIHPKHLVNKIHLKNRFDLLTKWITLDNGDKIPLGSNFGYEKMAMKPFKRFIHRLFHITKKTNSITLLNQLKNKSL